MKDKSYEELRAENDKMVADAVAMLKEMNTTIRGINKQLAGVV